MDILKWFEKDKNKVAAMIVVSVLVIIMLSIKLYNQVVGVVDASDYPDGNISGERGDFILVEAPSYLTQVKYCPALGIYIALPSGMELDGNYLVGTYNGVTYVVGNSKEDMVTLCKEELYRRAVTGVLGYETEAEVRKVDTGYMYGFDASYSTMTLTTRVSTNVATHHSVCYSISSDEFTNQGEKLILYANSEDIGSLKYAEEVLRAICLTMRFESEADLEEDMLAEGPIEIGEGMTYDESPDENPFEEPVYTIDVYWKNDGKGYTNTVLLVEWVNVLAEPRELSVYGPNGQLGIKNKDYSMGGHYVYELGITEPGTFHIVGSTDEQLTGVNIGVMSMIDYLELYHYSEVNEELPDYIQNRADEGEPEEVKEEEVVE